MAIANYIELIEISTSGISDPVFVEGCTVKSDGGQGLFYWDDNNAEDPNFGTIFPHYIFPPSTPPYTPYPPLPPFSLGRWIRICSGAYNAQWFNINPANAGALNTTNLQNLIDYLASKNGGIVYLPEGEYSFCGTIELKTNVTLEGAGSTQQALYNWGTHRGTVLLFDVAAGKDCLVFQKIGSKITANNFSIYITNTNQIGAVVNITGVTYASLDSVEIGSTVISPGTGLLLSSETEPSVFARPKETLYGVFNAVTVAINDTGGTNDASLQVGLHILGHSYTQPVTNIVFSSVVNSNTFTGCQFTGRQYPLLIEKDTIKDVHSQSLTFVGCAFESYYYDGYADLVEPYLVLDSEKLHGLNCNPPYNRDWVVFRWIKINATRAISFKGCYFELQDCPTEIVYNSETYNLISAIELGVNTMSTSFDNSQLWCPLLDYGISNYATYLLNGYQYYRYEKPRLVFQKTVGQLIPDGNPPTTVQFDYTPGIFPYPPPPAPPYPEYWEFQPNVIDFQDSTTVVIKERGAYFVNCMVSFPIDFPAGGIYFCAVKIVAQGSIGTLETWGAFSYGSGSTTNMISAQASAMFTLNEEDTIVCQVVQNTGSAIYTSAEKSTNFLNVFKV